MLPTYPKLESYRKRSNLDMVKAVTRQLAPMLETIDAHIQFEGQKSAIQRETGELDETRMNRLSAEAAIERLPLRDFTEDVVNEHLTSMAEQFARGMTRYFQEFMNETAEKTGNVVNSQGKPFNEDLFLDAIETLDHSFGLDGKWQPPTVIVHPSMAEAIAAAGGPSPEGAKRLEVILERKRDEFRRREASRILVG